MKIKIIVERIKLYMGMISLMNATVRFVITPVDRAVPLILANL